MEKNKKILYVSFIMIIISLITSIAIIIHMKIDKPIFLKNYCEIGVYENDKIYSINQGFFNLQYISNIDDDRVVTGITFKELPGTYFYASEYNNGFSGFFYNDSSSNLARYGRYGVHTVYISCPDFKYEDGVSEVMLREATVEFNDGLKLDVDLGEIYVYKEKNTPIALDNISYSGTSTFGEMISTTTFKIKEDAKIENIESPLMEKALGIFKFSVNSLGAKDIIKASYKEGDNIVLTSIYNAPKDIVEKYTVYDIRPKVHFINSYKDRYTMRFYNMTQQGFNFTSYEIYKYIKARGEV